MAHPTNVFHLVNGTVEKFVGEFIDYLDGIPSKNFCPNGRTITPAYAKILRSRVKEITSQALTNCERKKCLGYIINDLMSPLQYCNMAGFNLVNLFGNFTVKYKGAQDEIKTLWHHDMMRVLSETLGRTILPNSSKPEKVFIAASEDYELDQGQSLFTKSNKVLLGTIETQLKKANVGQPNIEGLLAGYNELLEMEKDSKSNINEFNTYNVLPNGAYIPLEKQSLNIGMFHNYYVEGHLIILNIHNSSSLPTADAIKEIYELLELFNSLYAGYRVIICGDSNVYYNHDNLDGITQMGNMLRENGYNLLISRNIPTKIRPRNFFQNAQSAEKGFKDDNEETMFIAYPTHLQALVSFDQERYFIVNENPIKNMEKIIEMTIWAFEGAHLGFDKNDGEGWEGINICNYHEFIFSDHMPIYMDIDGIRIIATNNVSVRGTRGVNYNMNLFDKKVDVSKLDYISNHVFVGYFVNMYRTIFNSLLHTESGTPLLPQSVGDEYNILINHSQDEWTLLKKLCQLKIC
jgi:hypothetical protein